MLFDLFHRQIPFEDGCDGRFELSEVFGELRGELKAVGAGAEGGDEE